MGSGHERGRSGPGARCLGMGHGTQAGIVGDARSHQAASATRQLPALACQGARGSRAGKNVPRAEKNTLWRKHALRSPCWSSPRRGCPAFARCLMKPQAQYVGTGTLSPQWGGSSSGFCRCSAPGLALHFHPSTSAGSWSRCRGLAQRGMEKRSHVSARLSDRRARRSFKQASH